MLKYDDRYLIYAKKVTLTRSDTTAAKVFELPRYASIVAIFAHTRETFNAATTLDVEVYGSANSIVSGLTVTDAGSVTASVLDMGPGDPATALTGIYMNLNGSATSGGTCDVVLLFITPKSKRNL